MTKEKNMTVTSKNKMEFICPYCGREMELDDRSFEGHGFWYTCDCGASTPFCKSEEEANQCACKAAQPKWISVEDRLPKNGKMVLAYTRYFYEVLQWDERNGVWVGALSARGKEYVTHWMPLPPCPEEVK